MSDNSAIAPSQPLLHDFEFASPEDEVFYHDGPSIKSRVRRLYGKHSQMAAIAEPMCLIRPWVIDYFEQFPALPFWLARGVSDPKHVGKKQQAIIAHTVMDVFDRRPRLKDVMRRWSIIQPLRKIEGQALRLGFGRTLIHLAKFNPSMVSQLIPANAREQRKLLSVITTIFRHSQLPEDVQEWLLRWSGRTSSAGAIDMMHFWARGGSFDFRWTWDQAAAARDRWHVETAHNAAARFGLDPAAVICTNPMPDVAEIAGFEFHALRTPLAIQQEGAAMHHCVGSYIPDVNKGRCAIVSMTEAGNRIATLEMTPAGTCRQLRGPCNSTQFIPGVQGAVRQYGQRMFQAVERQRRLGGLRLRTHAVAVDEHNGVPA